MWGVALLMVCLQCTFASAFAMLMWANIAVAEVDSKVSYAMLMTDF
jgi:hypothetical protein